MKKNISIWSYCFFVIARWRKALLFLRAFLCCFWSKRYIIKPNDFFTNFLLASFREFFDEFIFFTCPFSLIILIWNSFTDYWLFVFQRFMSFINIFEKLFCKWLACTSLAAFWHWIEVTQLLMLCTIYINFQSFVWLGYASPYLWLTLITEVWGSSNVTDHRF